MNAPKFPVETLGISVSQVKTFLMCPRKYRFRYVAGAPPEFTPMNLAFGSIFHATVAFLLTRTKETGHPPGEEELQQHLFERWAEAGAGPVPLQREEDDKAGWDDLLATGFSMLGVARPHFEGLSAGRILAVEMPFVVDLHHPVTGEVLEEKLTGVIDAVVEEDGRPMVVELKTAAKRYSADQLAHDVQPTAYGYAARRTGLGDVGLQFLVVTKGRSPQVQVEHLRRDSADEADLLATIDGVLKAVSAGVDYPVRGWQCRTCPFKARCAAEGRLG